MQTSITDEIKVSGNMLPDVQVRAPEIRMPISRAGVSNVRKLLRIKGKEGREVILSATFECYVDLPSFQKGTHMSRNLEAINEVIEEVSSKPAHSLEELCGKIVLRILERHSYASMSEVRMESTLMLPRRSPAGRHVQDFVRLFASARAERGGEPKVKTCIGAELRGIIATSRGELGCIQQVTVRAEVESEGIEGVRIEELIKVLESSVGARAHSSLTCGEEAEVLREVCASPASPVEVVEAVLGGIAGSFPELPDSATVTAMCTSAEPLLNLSTTVTSGQSLASLRAGKSAAG
ncbi:MAG: GTP cyclohydrolase I FolE2 [Euryarchaeota archaeon]|nr:GTP cyclohydrolase I FolE2 [Euryarchaeota archaeon]